MLRLQLLKRMTLIPATAWVPRLANLFGRRSKAEKGERGNLSIVFAQEIISSSLYLQSQWQAFPWFSNSFNPRKAQHPATHLASREGRAVDRSFSSRREVTHCGDPTARFAGLNQHINPRASERGGDIEPAPRSRATYGEIEVLGLVDLSLWQKFQVLGLCWQVLRSYHRGLERVGFGFHPTRRYDRGSTQPIGRRAVYGPKHSTCSRRAVKGLGFRSCRPNSSEPASWWRKWSQGLWGTDAWKESTHHPLCSSKTPSLAVSVPMSSTTSSPISRPKLPLESLMHCWCKSSI